MFEKIYKNSIIEKSKFTLLILTVLLLSFGYFAKDFQLDASSDTLLLENDPDLKYLREVNTKYGSKDFLVLTYTPKNNLLASDTIKNLTNLKNDLINLTWANNIITILDVPLLKNNDDPLAERIKNFKTLSSEDVDKERGFNEIINSPIYKEFIISKDGKTSGILVYIKIDKKLSDLIRTKNNYLDKKDKGQLTSEDKKEYKKFLKEYDNYKKLYNQKNKFDVIIGMYHDQILTPFKALFNFDATNVTLGLPYIRTSPDHGVAQNIIGKRIANPRSLIESIKFFNYIK